MQAEWNENEITDKMDMNIHQLSASPELVAANEKIAGEKEKGRVILPTVTGLFPTVVLVQDLARSIVSIVSECLQEVGQASIMTKATGTDGRPSHIGETSRSIVHSFGEHVCPVNRIRNGQNRPMGESDPRRWRPPKVEPNESVAHAAKTSANFIVAVQSFSRDRLFETPWTIVFQTVLSSVISQSLVKLSITVRKHRFRGGQLSEWSNSRSRTYDYWEGHNFDRTDLGL
ncbi:hypothetical protein M514_19612 [Trichuris suis]|uniref:Uncharacterized protein n=1 Tax=Trichuris suis TaxID=68888 RepID=A0A085NF84_9BILA|nr:hypothetical protein M514_19612 [Trichuris suis]